MSDDLSDGCGNCVTPADSALAFPVLVRATPDGEVKAHYRCTRCGKSWQTSWNAEVLSLPTLPAEGAA